MNPNLSVEPGDPSSPVLLHVPHSSRAIPDDVRSGILLPDDELKAELDESVDTATDQIAATARRRATATPHLAVNRLSRLVVDPERFPDDTETMNRFGRGAVYVTACSRAPLREPTDDEHRRLIDDYFAPYAAAMTEAVDARLAETGRALVVDVHSYPAAPSFFEDTAKTRPEICVGVDAFHTPTGLVDDAAGVFAVFGDVEINTPYAGCYVPLRHYRTDDRVRGIMIEIRRDVYLDAELSPRADVAERAERLGAAIAALCDSW